jgi:glutathione S-transferase
MKLRASPMSPFARKVRMAIIRLGFADRIEIVRADPMNPEDSLRRENPLGKIPALIAADGGVLYDSRVILEYLDHLAGGGIILPDGWPARRDVLVLQALCDGIMDAGVLISYESRHRPEAIHHPPWLDYQRGKVARGVEALAKAPPDPADFNVGTIAASCMLGYLDFRRQIDWRKDFAALVPWLVQFRARHAEFDATAPPPA